MKPLYIWAGGKNKMIPKYLESPGIPTADYSTYVEPFFGGGAMMIWVKENCPDVTRFVLNDVKDEIVGIYTAIKTDLDPFIARMDSLSSKYLPLDKPEYPKIKEVSVVAAKSEKWGERPVAVVAPKSEHKGKITIDELVEHLTIYANEGKIMKWWIPAEFVFVDEIPKTSVGKFDKKVARKEHERFFLDE